MISIGKILGAILLGIGLYSLVFGVIVSKPLSVGVFDRVYTTKKDYGNKIDGPKIIVAGGSGPFYSVRCEVIQTETNLPCVNISIAIALGRETILEQAKQVAKPGDIVLLPWEFRLYFLDADKMRARISYPYIIRHEKKLISALGFDHFSHALFYFDLKFLFNALLETSRFAAGKRHGFDADGRLTSNGDYQGHTAKVSEKFTEKLAALDSAALETPKIAALEEPPSRLPKFFKWAATNNVRVLGTLPASFNTSPIDVAAVEKIQAWYGDHAEFFVLDNFSQYPKSCFYDTREHLNEECQIQHSKFIAAALIERL